MGSSEFLRPGATNLHLKPILLSECLHQGFALVLRELWASRRPWYQFLWQKFNNSTPSHLFQIFFFCLSFWRLFFMIYPEEEEDALFCIYIRILVNDGTIHTSVESTRYWCINYNNICTYILTFGIKNMYGSHMYYNSYVITRFFHAL